MSSCKNAKPNSEIETQDISRGRIDSWPEPRFTFECSLQIWNDSGLRTAPSLQKLKPLFTFMVFPMAPNVPSLLWAIAGLFMAEAGDQSIYRIVLEALPLGIYMLNREGKIVLWSAGAEHITGYLRQDVLGRLREDELLQAAEGETESKDDHAAKAAAQPSCEILPSGQGAAYQITMRSKSGHFLPSRLQAVPLRDDLGKLLGTVKIFEPLQRTVSDDRRQSKLGAFGCLDALTGALNHSMIQAHLKECLNLYVLYPVPFSVLCFAIDELPKLRDRCGQAAVDAALRVVAQTIEHNLRPCDFVGRLLDQEFLAIIKECSESDVASAGERLRRMVQNARVSWWGDTFQVSVSVGATTARDLDTPGSIVGRAEEGLRESSAAGGNRVVVINT